MSENEPTNNRMNSPEERDLLKESKLGKENSFRELMQRYLRPVFNFAKLYSTSTEEAEDITQETFLKVWISLKHYDENRPFRPWLFQIAKNTAYDYLKKKRPLNFSALENDDEGNFEENLADPEPSPSEVFEMVESSRALEEALSKLKTEEKTIIMLHYHEEITFEEIAQILKKPMNTVKSLHRRSLGKLRELLLHQNDPDRRIT